MILAHQTNRQAKELSNEQLAEVRVSWIKGVPLRAIARLYEIEEQGLRTQLEEFELVRQMAERRRQLDALHERFGGRNG